MTDGIIFAPGREANPLYVEPEGALYHSQRGYWQQLLAYRQHKANGEAESDPDWLYALIAAEMERD